LVPLKRIGNHDIAAAYIDVSPKTLAVQQFSVVRRSASKMGKTSKPGAEGYIEGRNCPGEDDNIQRPAKRSADVRSHYAAQGRGNITWPEFEFALVTEP
jgi:hypothetical protein